MFEGKKINSKFFKKEFPWYKKDVYHLSFVAQDRFKCKKPFNKRKNKCLATGTWGIDNNKNNKSKPYLKFYNVNSLQPRRLELLKNLDNLKKECDSIMPPLEDLNKYVHKEGKNKVFQKIRKV